MGVTPIGYDEWEEAVDEAVEEVAQALVEADDRDGARAVRVAWGHSAAPGEAIERAQAIVSERGTLPMDHAALRELAQLADRPPE